MARILIVEDEEALARSVRRGLEDEGYRVTVEHDGQEGLFRALSGGFDLVVVDRMLPRFPGDELCRRLRLDALDVPILMLTARDSSADIVSGLDAGADDYVTKPFVFDELLARIRALLRRAHGSRERLGPLEIDAAAQRVFCHGEEIVLTAKEYLLLEALVRGRGRVLSKAQLALAAWDDDPGDNVIEVYISSLRRKLPAGLIHTRRGLGYLFEASG